MPKTLIRRVFSGENQMGNLAVVEVCESRQVFNDTLLLQQRAKTHQQPISVFIIADNSNSLLSYSIRWFSPTTEVTLCGHGTLAAADLILSSINTDKTHTKCLFSNKDITVKQLEHRKYILYLPPIKLLPTTLPSAIAVLFNAEALNVMQTKTDIGYLIVSVKNQTAVRNFDFDERKYSDLTQRALIVSCKSKDSSDLIYFRYFAPQYGEKEDSATGSAAPVLAEFWRLSFDKPYRCKQLSLTGGYYQLIRGEKKIQVVSFICDA
jgi:PhzF family phenazine biosynthesis protein